MPYRIDLRSPPADILDRLVPLGTLDIESEGDALAALLPDGVDPGSLPERLGTHDIRVSDAVGRDDGSVWRLRPRPMRIGRLWLLPAERASEPDAVRLVDGPAFGTGCHASTVLCLEAFDDLLGDEPPTRFLDIGTGSGVLALAALFYGVPEALGVDIDPDALTAAVANAALNGLEARLTVALGGPEVVAGRWPLIMANVLAAPLMEMAPVLVQRVAHGGCLVLSGIHESVADEVSRIYRRLGMRHLRTDTRDGWAMLVLQPSW